MILSGSRSLRSFPLRGARRAAALCLAGTSLLSLAAAQTGPDGPPEGPPEPSEAERDDATTFDLEATVVTPMAREELILDVPYTVQRIPQERLEFVHRTLPEAMQDIPGVMPQATGTAQGSPFIRGFTGFRTLLLVDGIRVNNSVFREGPNQYAGTIDVFSLQGIEVVKGPSSVLYGSDAIGGTISALTKDPVIWDSPIGGRFTVRGATAGNYSIGRLELGGAIDGETAWHLGGTFKDFGDVESGAGELPNTGYDELDGDFKIQHRLDEFSTLTFAVNRVDIDDAPRTHRTVDAVPFEGSTVGSDLVQDLDQTRTLSYLRLDTAAEAFGDWETQTTLSHHRQEESRFRIRTPAGGQVGNRTQTQGFDVDTLGLQFRATRGTSFGRVSAGAEWYRDSVDSFRFDTDDNGTVAAIQGPIADDSTYDLAGAYAEVDYDLSARTTITAGIRGTYASVDANETVDLITDPNNPTLQSIEDDFGALTGSLRFQSRLVETAESETVLFGGVSQGFRAPNLSDLTRVDIARSNDFEVPSTGLDPEQYVSYELGVKHQGDDLSVQFAGFLTDGDDVISRIDSGQTTANGETIQIKENVGKTLIGGLELGAAYRMTEEWEVFGNIAWLDGQQETRAVAGGPVIETVPSRLQPLTAQLGLRFEPEGTDWAFEARWLRAEEQDRLAPNDIGDTQRIPPGGTPGYDVFGIWSRYQVSRDLVLTAALENITDENYRVHGSGQNMPGRNLVIGASWSF